MRRRDRSVEGDGVELISFDTPDATSRFGADDGAAVWGVSGMAAGDDDEPSRSWRSGWAAAGVLGAVLAVVAVGSLVSSHGDGDAVTTTRAPASSSVPRSTTTTPVVPTTAVISAIGTGTTVLTDSDSVPSSRRGYVLADVPTGLGTAHAFDDALALGGSGPDGPVAGADVQLWATPGASRQSGAWMLIEVSPYVGFGQYAGHRVALGSATATVAVAATSGVVRVEVLTQPFVADPSTEVFGGITVTSFGLSEDVLLAAVASISVDADGLATVASIPAGLVNRIHTRRDANGWVPASAEGLVTNRTYVTYEAADEPDGWRGVQIVSGDMVDVGLPLVPFLLDDVHTEHIGGTDYTVGVQPSDGWWGGVSAEMPPTNVAIAVQRDGTAVVISSNLRATEFGAALTTLQRATDQQWARLVAQSAAADAAASASPSQTPREPLFEVVARAPDGGLAWSVAVAKPDGALVKIRTPNSESTMSLTDPVFVLIGDDPSFVVAHGLVGELAGARVVRDGVVVTDVAAVSALDGAMAIVVIPFDGFGPFTVETYGPDGGTLTSTTS